jgi:hypothetical protein
MDPSRFDRFTEVLAEHRSRRAAVAGLLALARSRLLGVVADPTVEARPCRHRPCRPGHRPGRPGFPPSPPPTPPLPPPCQSTCANRQCGDDGCGGSCGSCPLDQRCENNQCVEIQLCIPACTFLPGGLTPDCCLNQCVNLQFDDNHCGTCNNACDVGFSCERGVCTGTGKGLGQICNPATDVCRSPYQCDQPTTRHTCSDTVAGISTWCCAPPGGSCTECDCCGDYYCQLDNHNQGVCVPNPEGHGGGFGPCRTDHDCDPHTPTCCNAVCVDTLSNVNACGGCANRCPAGQTCGAGVCSPGSAARSRHGRQRAERARRR